MLVISHSWLLCANPVVILYTYIEFFRWGVQSVFKAPAKSKNNTVEEVNTILFYIRNDFYFQTCDKKKIREEPFHLIPLQNSKLSFWGVHWTYFHPATP